MKKRLLSFAMAVMLLFCDFYAFGAEIPPVPTFTVETVKANPGEEVDVNIDLSGNTGITGAQLTLSYPENFQLLDIEKGEALSTLDYTKPGNLSANPVNLTWAGVDADFSNGTALTLKFKVSENEDIGKKEIKIVIDETQGGGVIDNDMEDIEVAFVNGGVIVQNAPMTEASAKVETPKRGKALADVVACGDNANYTGEVAWYEGSMEASHAVSGNAKASTVYVAKITLTPKELYSFAESAKATVNGSEATANRDENGNLIVIKTFEATEEKETPVVELPTGLTATYGDVLSSILLKNPDGNPEGSWAWLDGDKEVGDSGFRTFRARFTPVDKENMVSVEKDVVITVNPKAITPTVEVKPAEYDYTGKEITPAVVMVKDGETEIPDTNYTLIYKNNTDVGTAEVTVIAAQGGNYSFTEEVKTTFKINQISATLSIPDPAVIEYDGEALECGEGKDLSYTYLGDGNISVVWYSDNNGQKGSALSSAPTDVGTYWIGVSASAGVNYQAVQEVTKKFVISPKNIEGATVILGDSLIYNGSEQSQDVESVKLGEFTVSNYDVSNNTKTNAGTYTLTVSAKGNYTGAVTQEFTIAQKPIKPTVETMEEVEYDGSEKTPAVSVKDGDVLLSETDVEIHYSNNINAGTANVTVKAKAAGNYTFDDVKSTFTIKKKEYTGKKTAESSVNYGMSDTVELNPMLVDGGQFGAVSTTDEYSLIDGMPTISEGKLSYQVMGRGDRDEKTAIITIPVTSPNYADYSITVNVRVTPVPKDEQNSFGFADDVLTLTYGDVAFAVATGEENGSKVTYSSSNTEVATVDAATGEVKALGAGTAMITAVASETDDYLEARSTCTLTVEKATVTIKARDKEIYAGENLPEFTEADYEVTGLVGEDKLAGAAIVKYQKDGLDVEELDTRKAGTYEIVISGVTEPEGGNYNAIVMENGILTINTRPSSGGGSSRRSNIVRETVTNPDGSTTTIITDKSSGDVTKITKHTDGTVTEIKTDSAGKMEAKVELSKRAVSDAKGKNKPVALPIPQVAAEKNSKKAPSIQVSTANQDTVRVEIPVKDSDEGVVVMVADSDGNETILKDSVASKNGVVASVSDGTTMKVVDNSKRFVDVADNHWGRKAMSFVSARELMNGTSSNRFNPEGKLTRGMVAMILFNYESKPETAVSSAFSDVPNHAWYSVAISWANKKGIVAGYGNGLFGPEDTITREQLASILWNYAGKPVVTANVTFDDAGNVSSYAQNAMSWAVKSGIISGMNGKLNPQGEATRAQVAAMIQSFIKNEMLD